MFGEMELQKFLSCLADSEHYKMPIGGRIACTGLDYFRQRACTRIEMCGADGKEKSDVVPSL